MSSQLQDGATSGLGAAGYRSRRSIFTRQLRNRPGLPLALATGFVCGIIYRLLFDSAAERDLANYLRSGLHGVGIAFAAWVVQTGFASTARSPLGAALRRLPVAGEVVIRSLVITAALVIVGVSLQLVIYAEPLGLEWFTKNWFTTELPRIVAIGFAISLVIGAITE
jgi:ABC-type uncharacterized transport system permease subunit